MCIDHKMNRNVCIKIIRNNKDFFDQCLDEIKLLKFLKSKGNPDYYNFLDIYDYFYYKEHLFIVSELLGKNLYEFYKFHKTTDGSYFTLPKIQKVTKMILQSLQFIHSLNIIHCDLKPENILMKDPEKVEVKIIDFGSSCFSEDDLSTYVQSRSYRAPEVILGMKYTNKIDIWSLGCIIAELYKGKVLFQNDSVLSLLAKIIGIIGPIKSKLLLNGNYSTKYFNSNGKLYELTEDGERFPTIKKSSLKKKLDVDDEEFIDFCQHLLKIDPDKRLNATEALNHAWIQKNYNEEEN